MSGAIGPVGGVGGSRGRAGGDKWPDIGGNKAGGLLVRSTPWNRDTGDGLGHGGRRLGRFGLCAAVAIDLAAVGRDGLPRAAVVAVAVRRSGGVIGHLQPLHVHREWTLTVVRLAASPRYQTY